MALDEALKNLGKEIQKDTRFLALRHAAQLNDADEDLQGKMRQMQSLSEQYRQETEKGEEADTKKIDAIQNEYQRIYNETMQNENMKNYSEAARELDSFANYITAMISKYFEGSDPETTTVNLAECTHDCSTCGGCGAF